MTSQEAAEHAAEKAFIDQQRLDEWWQDELDAPSRADYRRRLASIPEPAELTQQCDAIAAAREHNATPCANCNRPRSAHVPDPSRGYGAPRCTFQEPA